MKKSKKSKSPFLSNKESLVYVVRSLFMNGDILMSEILQEALCISEELANEVATEFFANYICCTPEEAKNLSSQEKVDELD